MVKYTVEEQRKHRKEWVKALRSGLYEQGLGALRNEDNQYCCLGVACTLVPGIQVIQNESRGYYQYGEDQEADLAPIEVIDYFGLITNDAGAVVVLKEKDNKDQIMDSDIYSLVGLNDTGVSFEEIADIIESEPEGMFEK